MKEVTDQPAIVGSVTDPPPEPRDPPIQGYEYFVQDILIQGDKNESLTMINDLGAQGWELVCITNIITDDPIVRAWFIRPLP